MTGGIVAAWGGKRISRPRWGNALMLRLVLGRLASFVPTLFVASVVLFLAVNVVPGSAARSALGIQATPQALKRFEHQHGLDRPLVVQYAEWAGKALRGDFGTSFQNAVAVGPEVRKRIPVTLQLAGMAFLVAIVIAVPLGLVAGFRHQTGTDGVLTTLATLFGSTPNFWLATLLIYFFSLRLGWLPTGGYTPYSDDPVANLRGMLLPCFALGVVSSGLLIRIMRTAVIEVTFSNFIETARSKGVSNVRLVTAHVVRNALIPFFTVSAVGVRLPRRQRGHHRGRVPHSGDRLAGARRHHQPRLPGPPRGGDVDHRHRARRQPRRRSGGAAHRPAPGAGGAVNMLRRVNWRRYGLVIATLPAVFLVFLASALAPVIAPYDPYALDVLVMLEGPSVGHLLGTDELGRDILSRVIQASRTSIVVGLVAVLIGASGGTLIGMLAAWFGGAVDAVLMRFMDIVFCFPAILLAVILMANLGTSVLNAMLAIGIIFIPGFARLTRAVAQTVQRQPFLEAAICLGVPGRRIVMREILPNVIGPVLVEAAVAFSYAVLLESALSFLGPRRAAAGALVGQHDQHRPRLHRPGTVDQPRARRRPLRHRVQASTSWGDGLRDVLDPKLRG